jgi:hypothetical protein
MNYYRIHISLILIGLMGIAACKKQVDPPSFNYDYYDLTFGRFIEYDVLEINHDVDQTVQHDTLRYQLKTVIGDTVIDNEGRIARKFIRYKRSNSNSNWAQTDLWTTIIDQNRAELVEENQRVIKMIFVPNIGEEWNANVFNMFPELNCYYRDIDVNQKIGAKTFESTLVVEQEDFFSMIDHRRKFEVYAKGVGLVYKHYRDLTIAGFDTLDVQKGKEMYYKCTNFGIQ